MMPVADTPTQQPVVDPRKSPSYPQRVHIREKPQWQGLLRQWEERIAEAGQKLQGLQGPGRDRAQRLYIQMQGARDQIADAVRRLPMEVGGLYEEDRLRVDEAVAALERLTKAWPA
jgi:hypothetical protein